MSTPPPAFLAENIRPDDQRPADTEVTERTPIAWKRVFRFLLPYWRQEVLLIAGMVFGIALSLVYPLLFRDIVDDVIGNGAHERLLPLTGMILGATTLGVALSAAAGWLQILCLGQFHEMFSTSSGPLRLFSTPKQIQLPSFVCRKAPRAGVTAG